MRRLITLTSTQGKTPDELVQEVMEAFVRYNAAEAKARETPAGPPPERDEPVDDDDQVEMKAPTAAE